DRGDISGRIGWWCPHRHRWYGLHRLLLLAPAHECCERAYAYDPSRIRQPRMEVPRVGDRIFTLPPTQHPKPNAGPKAARDEMPSKQSTDRFEPGENGEEKRPQKKPHHEHEKNLCGPLFRTFPPTPSAAPLNPAKLAAVCLARSSQGCTRR